MKPPRDIHDALRRVQSLLSTIARDADNPDDPIMQSYPEYFEPIKDAALDAHLLVTWVRDQLSYPKEES
jgi:hypothetical protein